MKPLVPGKHFASKWIGWIGLLILILIPAALLIQRSENKELPQGPVETLTISTAKNIVSALIYIAEAKGFFKANGLNVKIREHSAGLSATDDLIQGQADIAACADIVFVIKSSEQHDLRILAATARAEDHQVIARARSGITVPADLKGKQIAGIRNTSAAFFLETFLSFHDISISDVRIIYLPLSEIPDAIAKGSVDATCAWEPNAFRILERFGPAVVGWPAQNGRDYHWLLVVKQAFLQKRARSVTGLLNALLQAERFTEQNPGEAQSIVTKKLALKPDILQSIWKLYDFRIRLDQDLLILMEDQTHWAMRRRIISPQPFPNYLQSIDMSFLEKIKPEAVGIIH